MDLVPGQKASNLEIMARWAYSELFSSRLGADFQRLFGDFSVVATGGPPFETLERGHHELLAGTLRISRGVLLVEVERHHGFVLQLWSKGRLCQCNALQFFNTPARARPMPFYDFLNWARNTGPDGKPDPNDPRTVADTIPLGSFKITEAPIAVGEFPNMLIDGYLRSVVFMRDAPADAMLPVWVGLSDPGWRAQITGAAATQ